MFYKPTKFIIWLFVRNYYKENHNLIKEWKNNIDISFNSLNNVTHKYSFSELFVLTDKYKEICEGMLFSLKKDVSIANRYKLDALIMELADKSISLNEAVARYIKVNEPSSMYENVLYYQLINSTAAFFNFAKYIKSQKK